MTKTWRHIALSVFFSILVVTTTAIGFLEGNNGFYAAIIVLGTLLSLILMFGVPVDFIAYGKFRVEFDNWGPKFGHREDGDDE